MNYSKVKVLMITKHEIVKDFQVLKRYKIIGKLNLIEKLPH